MNTIWTVKRAIIETDFLVVVTWQIISIYIINLFSKLRTKNNLRMLLAQS